MSSTRDRIVKAIIAHMAGEGSLDACHTRDEALRIRAEWTADHIMEIVDGDLVITPLPDPGSPEWDARTCATCAHYGMASCSHGAAPGDGEDPAEHMCMCEWTAIDTEKTDSSPDSGPEAP